MLELTIKSLTAERLKTRKENPIRANVLLMLVNDVKNITINDRRPETEADFRKAAVKMYNEVKDNITTYESKGVDASELKAQLKEIEPFLPTMLSEEKMIEEAKKAIESLPADQRVMKNIMPKLKVIDGFDMKA